MKNYYDYEELFEELKKNNTKENRIKLGKWFENFGGDYWNGEFYDLGNGFGLRPVYKELYEEPIEVVDYEII